MKCAERFEYWAEEQKVDIDGQDCTVVFAGDAAISWGDEQERDT